MKQTWAVELNHAVDNEGQSSDAEGVEGLELKTAKLSGGGAWCPWGPQPSEGGPLNTWPQTHGPQL